MEKSTDFACDILNRYPVVDKKLDEKHEKAILRAPDIMKKTRIELKNTEPSPPQADRIRN